MKGFGIYVKNDLLEPKHIKNMGEAIWLYLWLLDKMTSVNENGVGRILGGTPITHDLVAIELGIPERTYTRWVAKLRKTGYITTIRTPYGLSFMLTKASKKFKKTSAKSGASRSAKSGASELREIRQIVHRDTPKVVERSAKLADVIKTKQDKTKTKQIITNVIGADAPAVYGKPELNSLFEYWQSVTGVQIQAKLPANRRACNNLLRKWKSEGVKKLIDGVAMAQADKYAPRISDFCDLQSKLNQLITWGKSNQISAPKVVKL